MYLAENLRVPKSLYERIAEIGDYKKYTSALLMILFDRETLATHSLQGRRTTFTGDDCPKPQLPPEILRGIIGKMALLDFKDTDRFCGCSVFWAFFNDEFYKVEKKFFVCFVLLDHVAAKFGVDRSQIKTAIRTKLNNEDKLLKKRLGFGKAESKAVVEPSFCQDASLLTENGELMNDS